MYVCVYSIVYSIWYIEQFKKSFSHDSRYVSVYGCMFVTILAQNLESSPGLLYHIILLLNPRRLYPFNNICWRGWMSVSNCQNSNNCWKFRLTFVHINISNVGPCTKVYWPVTVTVFLEMSTHRRLFKPEIHLIKIHLLFQRRPCVSILEIQFIM
jgi:hypothetical protein